MDELNDRNKVNGEDSSAVEFISVQITTPLTGGDELFGLELPSAAAAPRNQIFFGQDSAILDWLLHNDFQRSFDCIYIDPPYLSDATYYAQTQIMTDQGTRSVKRPVFQDSGYNNLTDYLQHLHEICTMIKELLSEQGSLFVHLDYHSSHYVKVMLDQIFSPARFINEIVWCYGGGSGSRRHFHRKHDVILWYSRGADHIFNPQYRPYTQGTLERGLTRVKGDRYHLDERGALLQDWWTDIPKILSPTARDNWKFPTQKPVELLQRIIAAATMEGSLVGDFYAGSGTTGEACEKLGRDWIMGDNNDYAIQTMTHRLIRNHSQAFGMKAAHPSPRNEADVKLLVDSNEQRFTVKICDYALDDESGPGWIDFWELGRQDEGMFISFAQSIPVKRGRPVPDTITLAAPYPDKLILRIWDIRGGCTIMPL